MPGCSCANWSAKGSSRNGAGRDLERDESLSAAQGWDVVVSDYSLPAFNAPAALAVLKESGLDIPFIVTSAPLGEEVAVETMSRRSRLPPKGQVDAHGRSHSPRAARAEIRRQNRTHVETIEHLNQVLHAIRTSTSSSSAKRILEY